MLVGSVFIGKRLGCLSYKTNFLVATGHWGSHCSVCLFLDLCKACMDSTLVQLHAGNQCQVNEQLHQLGRCAFVLRELQYRPINIVQFVFFYFKVYNHTLSCAKFLDILNCIIYQFYFPCNIKVTQVQIAPHWFPMHHVGYLPACAGSPCTILEMS